MIDQCNNCGIHFDTMDYYTEFRNNNRTTKVPVVKREPHLYGPTMCIFCGEVYALGENWELLPPDRLVLDDNDLIEIQGARAVFAAIEEYATEHEKNVASVAKLMSSVANLTKVV